MNAIEKSHSQGSGERLVNFDEVIRLTTLSRSRIIQLYLTGTRRGLRGRRAMPAMRRGSMVVRFTLSSARRSSGVSSTTRCSCA